MMTSERRYRQESRNNARFFRRVVRKEFCEVCGFLCGPIANIHHVVSVANGGDGMPENLISLCPNCHAAIHRLRDTLKTGDEKGLLVIGSWIECVYSPDVMRIIGSIAFETAIYDGKKWIARDSILSCPVASITEGATVAA